MRHGTVLLTCGRSVTAAAQGNPGLAENERSRAANLELAPIDRAGDELADYSGPLVSDLNFAAFSHSALPRGGAGAWRAVVVRRPEAASEAEKVMGAKFSTGTTVAFELRRSLPLAPC